jgi:hypothetical protein
MMWLDNPRDTVGADDDVPRKISSNIMLSAG